MSNLSGHNSDFCPYAVNHADERALGLRGRGASENAVPGKCRTISL